jgi:hypothetical protein
MVHHIHVRHSASAPRDNIVTSSYGHSEFLMPRPKLKSVTHNAAGVARAAKSVRDLLSNYTKQRDMKEGPVGLLLYGFLVAKLGAASVRREQPVETTRPGGSRGRREQIDFVLGRKSQTTGAFAANTVIEFAVRRTNDKHGIDAVRNLSEIKKLVRAEAKHRVLLLVDLTTEDAGKRIVHSYTERGYTQGRPRGAAGDRIRIIYVGEHGSHRGSLMRQALRPRKRQLSG